LGSVKSLFLSVVENSPALIVGLGKFFFPFNLAIMPVLRDVNIVFGLGAVGLIAFLAFTKRINKTWLAFGLLWFILFMLPSFVNPNPEEFYYLLLLEHRLYLPFIGLIFIIKDFSFKKLTIGNRFFTSKMVMVISLVVISCFTFLTIRHLPNFKNNISFWSFAVSKSPNSPLAHRNYGAMLYFNGQLDEAEEQYKEALKSYEKKITTDSQRQLDNAIHKMDHAEAWDPLCARESAQDGRERAHKMHERERTRWARESAQDGRERAPKMHAEKGGGGKGVHTWQTPQNTRG